MSQLTTVRDRDTRSGNPRRDDDRALALYTERLGLRKQIDVPLPQFGGRWITVAPQRSATSMALVSASD